MTTTEQDIVREAPARRAVPKTGQRRPGVSHQSKPRPRTEPAGRRPLAESARPAPAAGTRAARPARRPARRQRAPFVLLVVGLLCGGLVSLLLLNTMLAQDAITEAKLHEEIAVARQGNEDLSRKYEMDTQPDKLAERAEAQGQHPDWDSVNVWDGTGQVDQGR
ncbi:hypothetical protein AB0L05_31895 [Nonomuraea pusilla]|uniref:hypothetical protein n=1 Tax=Nonomuraea pusilla TaxID=46177 RepID=UPI0033290F18